MTRVLYTTSFNETLYNATGRHLIDSFLDTHSEGDLLVTYEDDIEKTIPKRENIISYNLEDDGFLQEWLKENKDIIPVDLGGSFPPCRSHRTKLYTESNMKCPNSWFNRRTCQWFRKIAAINKAISMDYEVVVFIDCDCIFTQTITEKYVCDIMEDNDVVFHLGEYRAKKDLGIESDIRLRGLYSRCAAA